MRCSKSIHLGDSVCIVITLGPATETLVCGGGHIVDPALDVGGLVPVCRSLQL